MNIINFCEQTKERGGASFSLPLGIYSGVGSFIKLDGTAKSYRYTDIESIKHYVKQYVFEHIDLLVDHDNYLNSYISKRKLYLYISSVDLC
jgi:hypothetical protein